MSSQISNQKLNNATVIKVADNWGSAVFEPQTEQYDCNAEALHPATNTSMEEEAPEKKLTLFAFGLAVLEKSASGIGALGFIWATAVLLGGFISALETKDFWFITVILLVEGNRIFSRSHELEWQHQATWSAVEAGKYSYRAIKTSSRFMIRALKFTFRPFSVVNSSNNLPSVVDDVKSTTKAAAAASPMRRSWSSREVPLLPYASWMFLSRNISKILYWIQILSACTCVSLSLMRLVQQDYVKIDGDENGDLKNLASALNIFYGLAFAEAFLFLTEKAYWEWKLSYLQLLDQVNNECDFGPSGLISIIKRFFYDSYSRCLNGSIFDGLKMDLVSFAEELLASGSRDEQLIGARILHKFVTCHRFADETLRKIGTSLPVIERLVDMLNWKNPAEKEIRRSAAVIVCKLAGKKQNALRVAGIPGAMESISSLLFRGPSSHSMPDEISQRSIIHDQDDGYELTSFNLLGLLILKKIAHDHDNCGKMGSTRGLLAEIIDFTSIDARLCRMKCASSSQIRAVKRSLQVVKLLASTTGHTGKVLRQEISEIVFTVSNIREILQYAENHMMLQKLGIEVLTSLAMDEEAREKIGTTGSIIKELLRLFFREGCATHQEIELRVEAGEALAMLALENDRNCDRILKREQVVERLVASLTDPVVRISSFRILKNLCAFNGTGCVSRLRGVTSAIPTVRFLTLRVIQPVEILSEFCCLFL